MITFRQKGDFSNLSGFLERAKETVNLGILNKYGRAGVVALSSATPVDTGKQQHRGHTRLSVKMGAYL